METYHIYIFDYSMGAIFHKDTSNIDIHKTHAIDDDGSWDFRVLITELGFSLNNVEYLVSAEPLKIVDL